MNPGDRPAGGPAGPQRVLLWMPSGRRVLGGHVVQLERTAAALGAAGLDVLTEFTPTLPSNRFDLVHGFGLEAKDIRYWHSRGVPVALSTIYWERSYRMDGGGRRPSTRALAGRGVRAAQFGLAAMKGRASLIEAAMAVDHQERSSYASFESADLLLPNAVGEGESIRRDLGVSTPIHPVPNGVDPERFAMKPAPFGDRGYVLYVGRIEPHKNQLGLIEALRGSGLPLVIAGHEHPDHPRYVQACREAGEGWVQFHFSLDGSELPGLYRGARVHVVPSWFETTGLVSLEAALSGCSLVSTSRGYAHEYLEGFARYCDPGEPGSILDAVRQAWDAPPAPELRHRILDRYTWDHVARATMAAYASLPPRSDLTA